MKLFHASLFARVMRQIYELFGIRLNVLLSYAYVGRDTKYYLEDYGRMVDELILDSGAWTVARGGTEISVEEYISYLDLWGKQFNRYFNLDTDFRDCGFDNNIAKQIKMERTKLKPVPVIHNFYDDEIDFYLEQQKYDWLALGSSQSTNFDALEFAVNRIKAGDPKVKIHWFGGSNFDWLSRLPIAACDTSSWAITGKFGMIRYQNPQEDKAHLIYVGHYLREDGDTGFDYETYPWKNDLDEYLTLFKMSPEDLFGPEAAYHHQVINTFYYYELEQRINAERLKRGIALE